MIPGDAPASAQPRPQLVIASANPGKQREIRELIGDLGLALSALDAFPALEMPEEAHT